MELEFDLFQKDLIDYRILKNRTIVNNYLTDLCTGAFTCFFLPLSFYYTREFFPFSLKSLKYKLKNLINFKVKGLKDFISRFLSQLVYTAFLNLDECFEQCKLFLKNSFSFIFHGGFFKLYNVYFNAFRLITFLFYWPFLKLIKENFFYVFFFNIILFFFLHKVNFIFLFFFDFVSIYCKLFVAEIA